MTSPYQLLKWRLYRHGQPTELIGLEITRKVEEHNQWHQEQKDGLEWKPEPDTTDQPERS